MDQKYAQQAIQLISVSASGKYTVTKEAEQFLKSVPGPIGVISVAGLYRTGKSYLLNRMILGRKSGFGVGNTINACTKGLWCWSKPIKGTTADGEKINILVIDTEGIGALDEDQTHDTRIFTLAVLASSCFIYNSTGSIDETAVQNLSLVVNLTKHIQLGTDKSHSEEDPDKIANYFPTFYWVIRDFSLQMKDPEGNELTSKQYLERALAPQKGHSEDIVEKNNIRKHLTSFFKDRECFTFVRPLIDEEKLQDLQKLEFDELRGDFTKQVIEFKKRIVNKMKPKTLHGQKLNGDLYISMLTSYVGAINEGAVPNIENAWNYMCQEQSTKIFNQSFELFEKEINDIKIPCAEQNLQESLEQAKEECFEYFRKNCIGQNTFNIYEQLKSKVRAKIKAIKEKNLSMSKEHFKDCLKKFPMMKQITKKTGDDQYSSLEEYLADVKNLREIMERDAPKHANYKLNIELTMSNMIKQGVSKIFKKTLNEREKMKQVLEEKVKVNENQIDKIMGERDLEQKKMKDKVSELDGDKIRLAFELEKMQIELTNIHKNREEQCGQLSSNLANKKAEIERMREEWRVKLSDANDRAQNIEKEISNRRAEWEKERAMFEQKLKHQQETIEEFDKKSRKLDSKLTIETTELMKKHQDEVFKYEEKVQDLTRRLNSTAQKYEDLNGKFTSLAEDHKELTERFTQTERKLKDQFMLKAQQVQKIKREQEITLNNLRNEFEQKRDDTDKETREIEEKLKKQEQKLKENKENFNAKETELEKNVAVLTKQLQFQSAKCEKLRNELSECRDKYESRIEAMEADKGMMQDEMMRNKITELKNSQEEEINRISERHSELMKELSFELESLKEEKNRIELQKKVMADELAFLKNEKMANQNRLKVEIEEIENTLRNNEREKENMFLVQAQDFERRIRELENDLENERANNEEDRNNENKKIEDKLIQMKNFYEMERDRQENYFNQEKERMKKAHQKKIANLEKNYQEQYDELLEEKERIESELGSELELIKDTFTRVTHEKETLEKQKNSVEKAHEELKKESEKFINSLNEKMSQLEEKSRIEREDLNRKCEELKMEKNEKEKENLSLTHHLEQVKSTSVKRQEEFNELKTTFNEMKSVYDQNRVSMEEKLKRAENDRIEANSRSSTTIALLENEKNHLDEKKRELQNQLKTERERNEQTSAMMQQKYEKMISDIKSSNSNERRMMEEKIENLRKKIQDNETNFQRETLEFNRVRSQLQEKLAFAERKAIDTEATKNLQIQGLSDSLTSLKNKFNKEKETLKENVDQLSERVMVLENDNQRLKNQSNLQESLLKQEIKNLTETKEEQIREKSSEIRILESRLMENQRRTESQINSKETNYNQFIMTIEKKYQGEREKLTNEKTKLSSELEFKKKELDRVVHEFTEKVALEKQAREMVESKIGKMENEGKQKEKKMLEEISKLRKEKDEKVREMERSMMKEKQQLKEKLEVEKRKREEIEKQRSEHMIDREKVEAKLRYDKINLEQKIDEIKDKLEDTELAKERLVRENEKLKAEKKKGTTSFINMKGNQTAFIQREVPVENKENTQFQ